MSGFKGWHVLGASFTTAMLVSGATFYAFQYFVTPVEKDLNLSREQVNYAMMIFLLSSAIWAALMGKLLQKFKPKILALLGIISFSTGMALLSQLHNPIVMLGVIASFVGFGFTACGPFMANALTTVWFYKHRGRALGIAAVATSVGGFVGQPVVSYLVKAYDWRTTLLVLALSIFVLSLGLIASVAGIAIGGIYPVWTSITADTFGREYFAVAIGLMNLITVIFALIGMGFIGRSHDTHGDYFTAFKVFIPVALLAAIVMMFVRTKRDHNA